MFAAIDCTMTKKVKVSLNTQLNKHLMSNMLQQLKIHFIIKKMKIVFIYFHLITIVHDSFKCY